MKKISQLVIKIIMILFILQILYMPISQASFWGDIVEAGDNFLSDGKDASSNIIEDEQVDNEFNRNWTCSFINYRSFFRNKIHDGYSRRTSQN